MHPAVILRILGLLLMVYSSTMLLPALVALIYDDGGEKQFFFAFAITLVSGLLCWLPVQNRKQDLRVRDGFVVVVLYDIIVANVSVAIKVLGPLKSLRPGFVEFPVELDDDFAIALLASTISLTPGTVSADVSDDRTLLLIHALDAESDDEVINAIRTRYEARLKEMFQ